MTAPARWDPPPWTLPGELRRRALSPALLVRVDHVRENLRRVLALLGGDATRWRPHVKTVKIPAILAELVRAGMRNFKCATTREAAELARVLDAERIEDGDVLLAQPLVEPSLGRLAAIARAHASTRFSVLCEAAEGVAAIPDGIGVFADVDAGMHRTGLALDDRGAVEAIARRAGRRFRGVHGYEGHLTQTDPAERRREAFRGYERLCALIRELDVPELITSGTPNFRDALAFPDWSSLAGTVHRVSPGTVVYHDLRSAEQNPDLDLLPAAVVLARVVSRPRPDAVTCDAGSKSIAAEAGDPCAIVMGYAGLTAATPSEEHLPLVVTSGPAPARGDELLLVPRHVCPTVNLADQAVLLEGDAVRGVVAVAARGHELLAD